MKQKRLTGTPVSLTQMKEAHWISASVAEATDALIYYSAFLA
jgi:hypothetical protein